MAAHLSDDVNDEDLAMLIARRGESGAAIQKARQACEQLYLRHAPRLLAFLAGRVHRSDLEDLHQGVWQRVWQHLPDGFHGGNFRAWLYQIARNSVIDCARKKRLQPLGNEAMQLGARDSAAENVLADQERLAILQRCLGLLSAETAGLVKARLSGESYDEICRRLGWKMERAHKLFHQAKTQLQTCVERAEQ